MSATNLIHLNGNVLCAIDVETTGTDPNHHEIVEFACIPLDANYEPRADMLPFHLYLQPMYPERIETEAFRVNGLTLADLMLQGMDKWQAADLFDKWFARMNLATHKRLSPLAHNWPFERGFVQKWLGDATFGALIDGRYRDTMAFALALNDLADHHNEACPFPKLTLGACCSVAKIEHARAHTAIEDAFVTAKLWKSMLRMAR